MPKRTLIHLFSAVYLKSDLGVNRWVTQKPTLPSSTPGQPQEFLRPDEVSYLSLKPSPLDKPRKLPDWSGNVEGYINQEVLFWLRSFSPWQTRTFLQTRPQLVHPSLIKLWNRRSVILTLSYIFRREIIFYYYFILKIVKYSFWTSGT